MDRLAKELRQNQTTAERRMWGILHSLRERGFHFRRQAPIGKYTVDFVCHKAKLVIEVDGETHGASAQITADARRTAFLEREGYRVLRVNNADVMAQADGVFYVVCLALNVEFLAHPLPSSPIEGEEEPVGRPKLQADAADLSQTVAKTSSSPLVGEDGRGGSHTLRNRSGPD